MLRWFDRPNKELRKYLGIKGIASADLAQIIGISDNTFCAWLNKPLTEDRKARVRAGLETIEEMRKIDLQAVDLSKDLGSEVAV